MPTALRLTSPRAALAALALTLTACSAGPASVVAVVDDGIAGARLTFTTEGKNSFTAAGVSCDADTDGSCSILIPAPDLKPGWNEVLVDTKRRTDEPVEARFFVPDALFGRVCTVRQDGITGDPAELVFAVECSFADGFRGSLDGRIMKDGTGEISAMKCLGDLATLDVDLERPLLRGEIPLDVVGRAGRLRRGIPVAVPAPVVQVALDGWASPWYEESLPLRVDAEPGATVTINGEGHPVSDRPLTVDIPIAEGPNEVVVVVTLEGHAPARHALSIEGKRATPLFLDQSYDSPLTTDRELLPLSGRTHRDAKLYLNGRPVDHRKGRFELDAFLEEGKNDVQLLAVIESSAGRPSRPVTRLDFEVHRVPALEPEVAASAPGANPTELAVDTVAADPWAHVGNEIAFPMRIESIAENLSMGGECSSRIEGLACTERVRGPVLLGWSVVRGHVCIGETVPVVVEAAECPRAVEGDDVFITGVVRGALGGRHHGITRDRPSVEARTAHRLPATELLPPERRSRYRPELLKERKKKKGRRR